MTLKSCILSAIMRAFSSASVEASINSGPESPPSAVTKTRTTFPFRALVISFAFFTYIRPPWISRPLNAVRAYKDNTLGGQCYC